MALLSVGGISTITTSYRLGHLSEPERRALIDSGAVGDVLYNFFDEAGHMVDNPINGRAVSVDLARLRKTPERVLIFRRQGKGPGVARRDQCAAPNSADYR